MQKVFIFGLLFFIVSLSLANQDDPEMLSEKNHVEYLRYISSQYANRAFGPFLNTNNTQEYHPVIQQPVIDLLEQSQRVYHQQSNSFINKPTL